MADPSVIVLHDYSGTRLEQRTRTSGKQHTTISFASTPIAVHLDPVALGRPVAVAIRDAIVDGIKAITAAASKATVAKREVARKALEKGEAWALKRYSGGRTGTTAPKAGATAMFNDSGRLADGITVNANPKEGSFTLNAPANRLNRALFGDDAQFARMVERLVELVPALRAPFDDVRVRASIKSAWTAMHQKRAMQAAEQQSKLLRGIAMDALNLARDVLVG